MPDRRAALVPLMSAGQAFSGPTAATIWELPLPMRWGFDERLHVSSRGEIRMRRPGVIGTRRGSGEPVLRTGMPVLDPAATWISLGGLLHPWDLTAVADRLISGTLTSDPLSSLVELRSALTAAGSARHIRRLRAALDDARVGAWSRPETLLRLLIARAALPEPVLNTPVPLDDRRVAYPDLAWPDVRIAIEYDGRWHDDSRFRDGDADRHERLVDAGWLVVRVRSADLFVRPSALIARLIRRLAERGRRVGTVEWARMPRFEP
ncbi:MAG TPA: hypothetical protein VN759_06850 [Pseudolysinimonas sp.]|nr:hypothetical protein [Pseudolysinimonas sp.]